MSNRGVDRVVKGAPRIPAVLGAVFLAGALATWAQSFVAFESGPVRPMALSDDGSTLYVTNIPDNRLEIFDVAESGLTHRHSVPVGMEPVSVALRANRAWVVNHLSDSVSIVDVGADPPRVIRTLLVGDEPRGIVFAGPDHERAFITTARRGQNSPVDPSWLVGGIPRALVYIFDVDNLGSSLEGTPMKILRLFGDTPRALAATPDGSKVYAAVYLSGNRTTVVHEEAVPNGTLPPPATNADGDSAPETGLIVRHDGEHWVDELERQWDSSVRFNLPDKDVFVIDAMATNPVVVRSPRSVGTVLFNMVVNPANGALYVSNTEAMNHVRFEGPGTFAGTTVRGHLHESRITVIRGNGNRILPRHLNKHIDYSVSPGPASEIAKSLAFPTDMAVSADGSTLYVAALGSGKVGVFSTAELEADTFTPSAASHIPVTGGGPSGLALDEGRNRLYVLTRFDNSVSAVDLATKLELQHLALHNPEPPALVSGRRFLYDAAYTSGHGDNACASCHVFGDLDALGWDLGNPDAAVVSNPNPFEFGVVQDPEFHPMKGPMTTQSLRGLANHGPMHWRGDRTAGNDTDGDPLDEEAAFKKFNGAFDALLGRGSSLTPSEMQSFTDFILQVTYPPNPYRRLDNSLTGSQNRGKNRFNNAGGRGPATCNLCHTRDPDDGFFGTDGFSAFDGEPQLFKIPHLRNMYQKVGMFGMPEVPSISTGDFAFKGDQVRGFGYLHDGSVDNLMNFLRTVAFDFDNDAQRRDMARFLLAFESEMAPIMGQQVTLSSDNAGVAGPRVDLMIQRADVRWPQRECQVIVKGVVDGEQRGWFRKPWNGKFRSDRISERNLLDSELRALAAVPGQDLTYTCVPWGSGVRMGVDRDEDGFFDRDEIDAGSDPSDAASIPATEQASSLAEILDATTPAARPARSRAARQPRD